MNKTITAQKAILRNQERIDEIDRPIKNEYAGVGDGACTVFKTVNLFLKSLWQDGALNGTEPQDAFFVICDETNNPPSVQRQFRLNVRIGLAPAFPAEFIDLTFEVDQRAINQELASFGLL